MIEAMLIPIHNVVLLCEGVWLGLCRCVLGLMVLYIPNNAHLIVQLRSLAITPHDIVITERSTYSSESVPIFLILKTL